MAEGMLPGTTDLSLDTRSTKPDLHYQRDSVPVADPGSAGEWIAVRLLMGIWYRSCTVK